MKHVVQYGIFAAYHLALETSFLADEGASLPEIPLNTPIAVALPDKSTSIERSISTVPGFCVFDGKSQGPQQIGEPRRSNSVPTSDLAPSINNAQTCLPNGSSTPSTESTSDLINYSAFSSCAPSGNVSPDSYLSRLSPYHTFDDKIKMGFKEPLVVETSPANNSPAVIHNHLTVNGFAFLLGQDVIAKDFHNGHIAMAANQLGSSEISSLQEYNKNHPEERGPLKEDHVPLKEEFPPAPSDHQSILVSLSSRCIWKGTVCERSHLFRIKYYGSFDKPLGRFLRDHLFDQVNIFIPTSAYISLYTKPCNIFLTEVAKLFVRVTNVVLVACHQKPMFIAILIDRVPSPYLLRS